MTAACIPDPCVEAQKLRDVRTRVAAGQQVVEAEFQGGDAVQRRVRYSPANLALLNAEINRLERECAIKTGTLPARPARRAFTFGGMR